MGGPAPLQAAADVLRGDRVSQATRQSPAQAGALQDTATIQFQLPFISSCCRNLQLAGLVLPELRL